MNNILTQHLSKYFLPGGNASLTTNGSADSKMTHIANRATSLINHFFSPIHALASKPVFTVNASSVVIQVFYYIPTTHEALNNNTVNNLGNALSSLFGRPVELRLVKLHYPYLDSYILAQYIAMNTSEYTLNQIVHRLFSAVGPIKNTDDVNLVGSQLPAHIVGLKIRASGRLTTEPSRPRQTVQTVQVGSFASSNLSLVDYSSYTTANKKGAITIKVWLSQRVVS